MEPVARDEFRACGSQQTRIVHERLQAVLRIADSGLLAHEIGAARGERGLCAEELRLLGIDFLPRL